MGVTQGELVYRMSMEAAELAQSALRFLNFFFFVFSVVVGNATVCRAQP